MIESHYIIYNHYTLILIPVIPPTIYITEDGLVKLIRSLDYEEISLHRIQIIVGTRNRLPNHILKPGVTDYVFALVIIGS